MGEHSRGSAATIAVVDVEITGFAPEQDELIGMAMVCVAVDIPSGELLTVIDSYSGRREPGHPVAPAAARIIGADALGLDGLALDEERIDAMLQECDLVVAHNVEVDRPFLARHVPLFDRLVWACSLRDIDWFGVERQPMASIDHLLAIHGLPPSGGTPADDCKALVQILAKPLPVSACTGFAAMLAIAHPLQLRFRVPDSGGEGNPSLAALGFEYVRDAGSWCAVAVGKKAETLQASLVDLAVYEGCFTEFSVEVLGGRGR